MNDSFDNSKTDREMLLRLLGDGVRMNQTAQDARERLLDAKMGSVANASDDFLMALEANLLGWIDEIQREVARREEKDNREAEADFDSTLDDAETWERNQVAMDREGDDMYMPDEQDLNEEG
jgi:hypothetical protein